MKMVEKKNDKNEVIVQIPNTDGWVTEQTGFAPYWNPVEGASFFGIVVEKDERDPEFVRYLMKAVCDTPCKTGSEDNEEDVLVKAGDYFTVSVYFSLQGLFDFYLENGINTVMKVTAKKQVPTKKTGRKVWQWQVQVSPKDKQLADRKRAELMAAQVAENKRLAEIAESAS